MKDLKLQWNVPEADSWWYISFIRGWCGIHRTPWAHAETDMLVHVSRIQCNMRGSKVPTRRQTDISTTEGRRWKLRHRCNMFGHFSHMLQEGNRSYFSSDYLKQTQVLLSTKLMAKKTDEAIRSVQPLTYLYIKVYNPICVWKEGRPKAQEDFYWTKTGLCLAGMDHILQMRVRKNIVCTVVNHFGQWKCTRLHVLKEKKAFCTNRPKQMLTVETKKVVYVWAFSSNKSHATLFSLK